MVELLVRLVFSLAVVVGLLLLTARLAGRRFKGRSGSTVQVLHRQALSRTSAVTVVTVGSRVLVLGTTEHQVRVLAELDPDELPETAHLDLEADDEPVAPIALVTADPERPVGRHAAPRPTSTTPPAQGSLAGSVLSPQTWRQALQAVSGRAS